MRGTKFGRTSKVFFAGLLAGVVALAFNFLLRLYGYVAFPPEAALNWFVSVVPASIEEPAVQQFGELAGQLGLIVATALAAVLYGLLTLLYDRVITKRLLSRSLSEFEGLLVFSLVPWFVFGIILFPLVGDSFFGAGSPGVSGLEAGLAPLLLLLPQALFAFSLASRYQAKTINVHLQSKSRREFIEKWAVGGLALIVGLVGLTNLGSIFSSQIQATGGSSAIDLKDAPAIFSDPRLTGLVDSEVTPNGSFYRVAIDIIDPVVDASSWMLTLDGLVGAPKTYQLGDLKKLPSVTQYTTMECVSNVIDGNLVSNAKWTGVKLSDLFADAGGAQGSASYVVYYSVDGYSVGIPLSKAMMSDSIIAYSMNDLPLPAAHGFPLRAINPGLYGMMSAKWVTKISLIDSTYEGYWQTRGWSNKGLINTVTFVVLPENGGQVSRSKNSGSVLVAGYAFAGDRRVSKVEVSVDGGQTWAAAQLKPALSNLTWVLWAYDWHPQSNGREVIYVRATDGGGQTQTSDVTDTFPNGATGYAYVSADVVD